MKKYLFDTCSIVNLIHYYNDKGEGFLKIKDFLKKGINEKYILILDKVLDEFRGNRDLKLELGLIKIEEKKEKLSDKIVKTDFLRENFFESTKEYYIERNEKNVKNKSNEEISREDLIEKEKQKFEETSADMYLIIYAKYLEKNGFKPIIVTDENRSYDGKLYQKIPIICEKEKIEVFKTPKFIFKHFEINEKENI